MHLLPGVAIQPNLELKTRPKQPLGSLPLVVVLPGQLVSQSVSMRDYYINSSIYNKLFTYVGSPSELPRNPTGPEVIKTFFPL
jgi:hypothetical protein